MSDELYPIIAPALAKLLRALTPVAEDAFQTFSQAVFQEGALRARDARPRLDRGAGAS